MNYSNRKSAATKNLFYGFRWIIPIASNYLKQDFSERNQEVENEPNFYHLDIASHRQIARHTDKHGREDQHAYNSTSNNNADVRSKKNDHIRPQLF